MKEIIINTVDVIRGIDSVKEDRLDTVLAESERILNKVNIRLERIEQRHKEIEDKVMELNALFS
ncbi:hypothetical protein CN417_27940 [Bacillus thuringiensis]|uniref:hypothetical protein n=1 Tax=Bacillus cereus group TaxID=86661 RepID=UPI000BF2E812|nr:MULTISPECIES: hypothetical protein [Bacillus cereus group]PEV02454.1 hypothetical protein CN417_27940 [Bacillus thuringiensis]PEY13453.1 hypothetical protein CN331_27260 [Bacillus cereus]PFC28772.1 hypothetical protein CN299_19135 [Bacillus thuringiensis]PHF60756.1 hypothetical protein COI40_09820 [Bacillus wiedmannii]PHF91536.1 hypothetical protein COI45_22675 [Bacillus wiedmannii]